MALLSTTWAARSFISAGSVRSGTSSKYAVWSRTSFGYLSVIASRPLSNASSMMTCSRRASTTRASNLSLFLDSVANDSKHFLADLVGWRDVIRLFQVPVVDLGPWHEAVDLDGVVTLDPYLLQLIILHLDIPIAPDLIPATDVLLFDRLPGLGVNKLLLQPIAGFSA